MEREEKQNKNKKNLGLFLLIFPIATNVLRRDCHCSFGSLKVQVAFLLPLPLHAVLWVRPQGGKLEHEREEWHRPFGRPRLARSLLRNLLGTRSAFVVLDVILFLFFFFSLLPSTPNLRSGFIDWQTVCLFWFFRGSHRRCASARDDCLSSSRGICFPTRIYKRIQETLSLFFFSPHR